MKYSISSPSSMMALGKTIAQQGYKYILLYGQLGAGKTHFTKGFAQGIGIDSSQVTSPTYTYTNTYDYGLLHGDFYRLEQQDELRSKGLIDAIDDHDYVILERPKWETHYADSERLQIIITITGESEREVVVTPFSG